MGEYADDAIDAGLDELMYAESGEDPDFTFEYFQHEGGFFGGHRYRFRPAPKTCKFCGAKNLSWGQTNKGWRLFDSGGNLHSCKRKIVSFPKLTDNPEVAREEDRDFSALHNYGWGSD